MRNLSVLVMIVMMISFFAPNSAAQIIKPIKPTIDFVYKKIGGSWNETQKDTLYYAWGSTEALTSLEGNELTFLAFDLPRSWSSFVGNYITSVRRSEGKILVSLTAYKIPSKNFIGTHHVLFDLSNNTSEVVDKDFTLPNSSNVAYLRGSVTKLIPEKCKDGEIYHSAQHKGIFVCY